MKTLKRCPCCHSGEVGPSFSFMTDDEYSAITIRCRSCGLMLTPVEHPTNDDGDLLSEDSDEVEEVLDDLAYDWNRRTKDNSVADVIEFSRTILQEIDRYANKVNGIEQINLVEKLRQRLKELEEIHCLEVKDGLAQAKHDTGSQTPNRQPYVAGLDLAQPQDIRPAMPNLGGISSPLSQGEDGMMTSSGGESVQSNRSSQQPRLDEVASRPYVAADVPYSHILEATTPNARAYAMAEQPCRSVVHNGSPDGNPDPAEL